MCSPRGCTLGNFQDLGEVDNQPGESFEEVPQQMREIYERLNYILVELLESSSPLNVKQFPSVTKDEEQEGAVTR